MSGVLMTAGDQARGGKSDFRRTLKFIGLSTQHGGIPAEIDARTSSEK